MEEMLQKLLSQFKDSIDTRLVVGQPIEVKGKVIMPVTKVFLGFGANKKETNGTSGGGAKVEPIGFLVIDEAVRFIPVNRQPTPQSTIIDYLLDPATYEKIAELFGLKLFDEKKEIVTNLDEQEKNIISSEQNEHNNEK